MTIQLPQQQDPLQKFLAANNPAPWNPTTIDQVFTRTFEQRREAVNRPQFSTVLASIPESVSEQMIQDFTALNSRVIAEWSLTQPEFKDEKAGKKLSSVYHRGPHGAEMSQDAKLLLEKQAQRLFTNEAQRALFIKMAQVAHAIHDVIQDKGPPNNEIASAGAFTKACNEIFDKYQNSMTPDQLEDLKRVTEHFGWETIVVGTTFDFKNKRPVVDILNEASKTYGDNAPKEPDPAIACATFACGKNDTRRMEVTLDQYASTPELQRLLALQFAATGGNNNVFMQFMNQRSSAQNPKLIFAARHMIGQNCRMICELKTHMGKDEVDAKLAVFLTNVINVASTTFDANQQQQIKAQIMKSAPEDIDQYFEKIIGSFKGDFGEIAFAKGLNTETFDKAVKDFNALYPENYFDLAGEGNLWQQYGSEAQAFIADIESQILKIRDDASLDAVQKEEKIREYKMQVIADLALYAGHQIGASLIRENKDTLQAYEDVIAQTGMKLQSILLNKNLPTDTKGVQQLLDELRKHRDNGTIENKENQRPNTLSFAGSSSITGRLASDQREEAIKLCEGLRNAMRERDRIQAQIHNLSISNNQAFGPPKEVQQTKPHSGG